MLLVCALIAPSMAYAAQKSITPAKAHARIYKLGLGGWVGVRLQSGVAFSGKVVSVGEQSFDLQKYNDPKPVTVAYSDLFDLQTGMPMASGSRNVLTPDSVHQRLLKRGLGNWVGVELQNGVAFSGRVISIDEDSFGMQMYGDSEVTPVAYDDVVYLQQGPSMKAFWIFMGAGIGSMAAISAVAIHEMNNNKPQMPTLPAQPVYPIY
jgi:hypothetical protein